MKTRKWLVLLALLMVSVSIMAGCSGSKEGAAELETVTILYPGSEATG